MSLFQRVWEAAEDPTPSHAIYSALVAYGEGIFTIAQIIDALDALVTVPHNAAERDDLQAIATNLSTQSTLQLKMRYLNNVHAACLAAGMDAVNENQWRAWLNI